MNKKTQQGTRIGSGGMATVYEGFDETLDRKVAIKVPAENVRGDDELLKLFFTEAKKMAQVSHQNVLGIYGIEANSDPPRMLMEFADAGTLLPITKQSSTPASEVLTILRQVLSGLGEIHRHGIIHRDLKPANILRKSGAGEFVYKIGDFGISKIGREKTSPFMTFKYVAPETLGGAPSSPATDIYALGQVAYELLLGDAGFLEAIREAWRRHSSGSKRKQIPWLEGGPSAEGVTIPWYMWQGEAVELPLPHRLQSTIPEGLSGVVWKMARKNHELRYGNCQQILADLDRLDNHGNTLFVEQVRTERVPEPVDEIPESPDRNDISVDQVAGEATEHVIEPNFLEEPLPPLPPRTEEELEEHSKGPQVFAKPWMIWAVLILVATVTAVVFLGDGEVGKLRQQGQELLESGDHAAAIAVLKPVVEEHPDDFEAGATLAKAYYQSSDYQRAQASFNRLLEVRPKDPEVRLHLGLIALSAENGLPQAIEHLNRAVQYGADDIPEAYFFLGFAYYKQAAFADAQSKFERFLEVGPEDSDLRSRAQNYLDNLRSISSNPEKSPGEVVVSYEADFKLEGFRTPSATLASFHGQVVVLHFWASWCAPCLDEMPSLLHFYNKEYPKLSDRGLELVTVSNDYTRQDLARFVDEVLGEPSKDMLMYWDPNWRLNESLKIGRALPQTVVLGRQGQVFEITTQKLDWQSREVLRQFQTYL